MDMTEAMDAVNYWAVIVSALSAFLIGGIWYSPLLFMKGWLKANKYEKDYKFPRPALTFGGSFVLALIISYVLVLFLGPDRDAMMGATAGFMAGVCWVAAAFGITYLFENKPLSLFFINAGYHAVTFTLMGFILGAWI